MARFTYEEVKKDSLLLDKIDSHADYASIDESMSGLMANPTKTNAKSLYLRAIGIWFSNIDKRLPGCSGSLVSADVLIDGRVILIAEKYGYL